MRNSSKPNEALEGYIFAMHRLSVSFEKQVIAFYEWDTGIVAMRLYSTYANVLTGIWYSALRKKLFCSKIMIH